VKNSTCVALLAAAVAAAGTVSCSYPTLVVPQVSRTDPARTVEAGEKPAVAVDSPAGSVSLSAKEGKEVTVVAERRGPTEADLDRITVAVEKAADGTVAVGWTATGEKSRLSVSFTITAPKECVLAVKTGAGSVAADGFTKGIRVLTGGGSVKTKGVLGDLALESGAGSVEVSDARGAVTVKTGGGPIRIADAAGDLRLESAAGSIEVVCGSGKVDAKTGGGRIEVKGRAGDLSVESAAGSVEVAGAQGRVQARTGGGSVRVEGDLRGECLARSAAGSIEVRLPENSSLVVDGRTEAGSIETEFPMTVEGKVPPRTVSGTLGDGKGGTLRIETGGGSIEIRKR